jgi:hypothetical protein
MKIAKIKFTEAQIQLLIQGDLVVINLPDAQIHITADRRKAADGFAKVGKKLEMPDFMEDFRNLTRDLFTDIMRKPKR